MTVTAEETGRITVIIVSYNTADLTLSALRGLTGHASEIGRIVVVDNASTDGSAERIMTEFPDVTVMALETNIGFGRAVNLAARRAETEFLLLLNPDVLVEHDVSAALLDAADRVPGAGLWGGRTINPDGSVNISSCWGLPTLWSTFMFALGMSTLAARHPVMDPESLGRWDRDTEREVGMVTGCLMLVRRELWEQVGGFDERFFMYGEDADLAFRVRARGHRPMITPTAEITHFVGASSPAASKLQMVMRAKVTIARTHLRAPRLAVGLLVTGVCLRGGVDRVLSMIRPGRSAQPWAEVMRSRRDWVGGYTDQPVRPKAGSIRP